MGNVMLEVFCGNFTKQFYLPDSMEGSFLINLYAHETQLSNKITIPLEAANGSWFIKTKKFKIHSETKDALVVGNKIVLESLSKNIKILIYVNAVTDDMLSFEKYYCGGMYEISIGRGDTNTIIINHDFISKSHAVICLENGQAFIKDLESRHGIYVNGQKTGYAKLSYSDVIYIMGVKIVYLNNIIAISNPNDIVTCQMYKYDNHSQSKIHYQDEPAVDEEVYFKRSPRILKKLETGEETVDSPPTPKEYSPTPLYLRLAGPGVMVAAMVITAFASNSNVLKFIMVVAMIVSSIMVPYLLEKYNKNKHVRYETKRRQKYVEYLKGVISAAKAKQEVNRAILLERFPSTELCIQRGTNRDRSLWERIPENYDFLEVRLGIGSIPFSVKIQTEDEGFTMVDDPLREYVAQTSEMLEYVHDAPISISLLKEPIIGMIGKRQSIIDLAKSMIVQLCTLHCYTDLKFVFFYEQEEDVSWSFVKWLPHTWSSDKEMRFIGTNRSEVIEIMQFLEPIAVTRSEESKEQSDEIVLPHFVVFISSLRLVENETLIRSLIEKTRYIGITLVYIQETLDLLPQNCNIIIQKGCLYKNDGPTNEMSVFKPDSVVGFDLNELAKALFKTKVYDTHETNVLPEMLTFLGMYQAANIEQIKIATRWATNLSYNSIAAPIGIDSSGSVFSLNIHDKFHGPHGLIAGMTGSGKSEFVQSFVLSVAINYHPYDVSFILIDYKGGGMANNFIGLPHVAGTITNLEGNQVKRSLAALKSELKRRQKIFNEAAVNHIDKYQKLYKSGAVKEPLPHLVIVSDEFAELKAQQSEFMHELVSTARIGRSLGVHLILATQKPSGVVDDQIWSNTTFRICLKVLDKGDSNQMLKRPEAAFITNAGRAFVQVGNNEIFTYIQSGWSGAPYAPADKLEDSAQTTVTLVDNCKRHIMQKSIEAEVIRSEKNQLEEIVAYIKKIADKSEIKPLELWRPPLKDKLILSEIFTDESCFDGKSWPTPVDWMVAPIGMADDTAEQCQPVLRVDFGNYGHVAIFGLASSGRTTFIQTLIYSLALKYSPDLVNMYILDFAGRTMRFCKRLPHVGDVVFSEEEHKVRKLFKMLQKELKIRKDIFSESGVNNIKSFINISEQRMPAIVIFINNYTGFMELYPNQEEMIIQIAREGAGYGIYLFIATTNYSAIKMKTSQNIKLMYAMQLNDKYEYSSIVGPGSGLEPEKIAGRGLARLSARVEFQTALAIDAENDAQRVSELSKIYEGMAKAWKGQAAPAIPVIPDEFVFDKEIQKSAYKNSLANGFIPIGYDIDEVELVEIPQCFFTYAVLGQSESGKTNFLASVIDMACDSLKWRVHVIDGETSALRKISKAKNVANYANNKAGMEALIDTVKNGILEKRRHYKDGATTEEIIAKYGQELFVIDNCSYFLKEVAHAYLDHLKGILMHCTNIGIHFIFAENPLLISYALQKEDIYPLMFSSDNGILLGGKFDEQKVFTYNLDVKKRAARLDSGTGFKFTKRSCQIIKTPLYKGM